MSDAKCTKRLLYGPKVVVTYDSPLKLRRATQVLNITERLLEAYAYQQ